MEKLVNFVDTCGHKRKGYERECNTCGKKFVTRKDRISRFCSRECIDDLKRDNTEYVYIICSWCDKEFKRQACKFKCAQSKSGLYFCTRKCKDTAQRVGGLKEIQPPHYKDGKHNYREQFSEEEKFCAICGFDKYKSAIDIHHIDHDRSHNDKKNLVPLCCNCHRAYHRGKIQKEQVVASKRCLQRKSF